jgi:hypothetical protein
MRAFQGVLDAFQLSAHPLIYVPGDNEWADCHHRLNAQFDPTERLAKLRSLFWMGDSSLGRRALKLERQSDMPAFPAYRENVRWEMGGVLFAGLNLPGSENNFYGVDIASRDPQGSRWRNTWSAAQQTGPGWGKPLPSRATEAFLAS